jgi:hypothetical protein
MLLKLAAKPVAADSTPVVELDRGAREQILIRVRTTGKSTKEELGHASKLAQDELDALMAKYPPQTPPAADPTPPAAPAPTGDVSDAIERARRRGFVQGRSK